MHVHLVWTSPLLSTVTSHKLWWSKDQYKNQYSILEEKSLSVVVAWAPPVLSLIYVTKRCGHFSIAYWAWVLPFCIQSPFGHRGKKSNKLRCINCICTIQHHVTKEFISHFNNFFLRKKLLGTFSPKVWMCNMFFIYRTYWHYCCILINVLVSVQCYVLSHTVCYTQ